MPSQAKKLVHVISKLVVLVNVQRKENQRQQLKVG